ncbi:hypothetical protein NRIC_19800 [Enterococcus florum]|uniref:YdhG-like domain-containing protein n=1 Tax=Enterococcus florum TaxID=2480627 RepID=A0A4V0WPJ6_9ENTE|nr:DUF1801 domain-containing protein [Enterococcus florum]GCF94089.1 hypothetical protein NRIC_19800 [Enterococcus florum]
MEEVYRSLAGLEEEKREKMQGLFEWIHKEFPQLEPIIKWNQPMFTDHGTYIIGFSFSRNHVSVSPEVKPMRTFADKIAEAGYDQTKNIFRIKWHQPIDHALLREMIATNINEKKEYSKFWRTPE